MRPNVLLVSGLVASTITALAVYRAVQHVPLPSPSSPAQAPRPNPVVIAAVDLPLGTVIEGRHLRTVDWPSGATPASTFTAPDPIVGRVTIARLIANEPLTNEKLAPAGAKGLLPLVIEPGMRAVTVKVNEVTGVGGFITPGSRVDVLITGGVHVATEVPSGAAGRTEVEAVPRHRSRTLLQNVTVLALGQVLETNDPKPQANVSTATMLVTPDQAELLALATTQGSLQLVLRSYSDNATVASPGKSDADLFDVPAEPVRGPQGPEAPTTHVELIRGAERVVLNF